MKHQMFLITFFLIFYHVNIVHSQNLISNSSFEQFRVCPISFTVKHQFEQTVIDWESPAKGTPDYYNTCGNEIAGVPINWAGVSEAKSGNGYVGLHVWNMRGLCTKEYIQSKLLKKLEAGKYYHVQLSFKISTYSKFLVDEIGIAFSEPRIKLNHSNKLELVPRIISSKNETNKALLNEWITMVDTFKADGTENYIIIGNFKANDECKPLELKSRTIQNKDLADKSYYYIDDVALFEICSSCKPDFNINRTFYFKNLTFEYNSDKIKNNHCDSLDLLISYLKNNHLKVKVIGNTDSVGGTNYNYNLAFNRAKSVRNYLVEKGIEKYRITGISHGAKKPIASNELETGRNLNRRVEFILYY